MKAEEFKEVLGANRLLLDGAMGTEIMRLRLCDGGPTDVLSISHPSEVEDIHSAYIDAGADIISTNTFVSDPSICRKAATLVCRAASRSAQRVFVAGVVGPLRNYSYTEAFSVYKEQISALIDGGVDIIMFETVLDTPTLLAGLDAAREVDDSVAIMISATPSKGIGKLLSNEPLSVLTEAVTEYNNVVSVGLNCGFGPDNIGFNLLQLSKLTPLYLSVHPNAGLPDRSGQYPVTPQSFAHKIASLLNVDRLRIIGGCCGTTPDHIAALRKLIG